MKIYVKFKRPRTVLLFLEQLYSRSVSSAIFPCAVFTYLDKECTQLQCNKNWRSYDDIYNLIHTYYPSISHKKLMHYLMILRYDFNGRTMYPHFGFCGGMGRLRYMPYIVQSGYSDATSKTYIWTKLFKLLNISSVNDYLNYKIT